MKKNKIIERAREQAALLKKNRKDPRYQNVMGFLLAKGFLHSNEAIHPLPNARVSVADAIWAGENIEPRILEVLPAAVLRLGKHFDIETTTDLELLEAMKNLLEGKAGEFYGIDLDKIRPWLNMKLKDGRVKKIAEKKIMKSFRLSPKTIQALEVIKRKTNKSETEIIEDLVSKAQRLS